VDSATAPEMPDELRTGVKKSNYRQYIAWLLILAVAVLIIYANRNSDRASNGILFQKSARFRALMLIGLKSMGQGLAASGDNRIQAQFTTAVQQIEQEARSETDKLRAAIIAAELLGKERALTALDAIMPESDAELAEDIASVRAIYTDGPAALEITAHDRLIHRYGDYGRIALAFGVAADMQPRKQIEQAALRSLLLASFIGLAMVLIAVTSIAFFILGVIFLLRKKIRWGYIAPSFSNSSYLEAFALYLLLLVGLGVVVRFLGMHSPWWNWLLAAAPLISLLWIRNHGANFQEVLQSVGLHRGQGWWREIGAGLMAYIGGLVFIVPCVMMSYLLIRILGTNPSHPIMTPLLEGNRWQVLGFYGIACILAPVTEETMFRGILFHHLRNRWSWLSSAIIVSFIFAVLHPQGWAAVPALGGIAIVLTGIREWRGSLIAPVAAHALNNFLALTIALLLLR